MHPTAILFSMKYFLKLFLTALTVVIAVSAVAFFAWYRPKFLIPATSKAYSATHTDDAKAELIRLKQKETDIKEYLADNNFNTNYCFMIDMRIASGKKRFFVINLKNDSVEKAGLVAHGSGSDKGDSLVFSNVPESKCTSLGRYKIGKPYNGRFGLSYKLHGLDKTNSQAFNRFVVLHPYWQVPEQEVAPLPICESYGCPMVAPGFLKTLSGYIDQSKKPIVLWIFY